MGQRVVIQGARVGFIDCHVHVTMSGVDQLTSLHAPFSCQFYAAERNLRDTLVAYLIDRPSLSRRTS